MLPAHLPSFITHCLPALPPPCKHSFKQASPPHCHYLPGLASVLFSSLPSVFHFLTLPHDDTASVAEIKG